MFCVGIGGLMSEVEIIRFDKPSLTTDQQIDLLVGRGLNISDLQQTKKYIDFIGYYRLSGYGFPFQEDQDIAGDHKFKPDTSFEQILNLYTFDRKLRLIVMDAIERIEVAVRSTISNIASVQYSPHWFLQSELFRNDYCDSFLTQVKKDICYDKPNRQENFIKHYYANYQEPDFPPSWMIMEVLTFGTISILYSNLTAELQKKVASSFGTKSKILRSWLHSLSCLRNLCAHHSRIWNRKFTIKPLIPNKIRTPVNTSSLFAQVIVLTELLSKISSDTHWKDSLKNLFDEYPEIDCGLMGFPKSWQELII